MPVGSHGDAGNWPLDDLARADVAGLRASVTDLARADVACEEVGSVPGVLEIHPSRYDPGDDVEWPSVRDEWWASDRAGDAFVVAAGDARGSLERFGESLASKLRSLAVQP